MVCAVVYSCVAFALGIGNAVKETVVKSMKEEEALTVVDMIKKGKITDDQFDDVLSHPNWGVRYTLLMEERCSEDIMMKGVYDPVAMVRYGLTRNPCVSEHILVILALDQEGFVSKSAIERLNKMKGARDDAGEED